MFNEGFRVFSGRDVRDDSPDGPGERQRVMVAQPSSKDKAPQRSSPGCPMRKGDLNVKTKMHHVSINDNVFFAFHAHFPG